MRFPDQQHPAFIERYYHRYSHRVLVEVYGDRALSDRERTCQKRFARFKSGDFDLEDQERAGCPIKFEDVELEALLDEDPCQTQEELALSLEVTQQNISLRLSKPWE